MTFSIAIYHTVFIVTYSERDFIAIPKREHWTRISEHLSARLVEPNKVEFRRED